MRVLWFSLTPSLYAYTNNSGGGWVASLEKIVKQHMNNVELGVAFASDDNKFKTILNGTVYYPIYNGKGIVTKLNRKFKGDYDFDTVKDPVLKIIDDFKPDIIQCFGSEWPYALISSYTHVPVVVHMQGFWNIYRTSSVLVYSRHDEGIRRIRPYYWFNRFTSKKRAEMESLLMKNNSYFMGRTNWDRSIVKHYSPGSTYYHCPESIREDIYNSAKRWVMPGCDVMRLITISNAHRLKGNEIILRTAKVLKEVFNFNFEWRVAGDKYGMKEAIKRTGIHPEKVNVKMIGRVSTDQIIDELSAAHAYVHAAVIDNSPNSLCEAQLIGCPVVASYVGGIPQMVEDGKTGLLYPYNEPHTLAFILMDLFNDKNLMSSLSKNELNMSKDRHSPEQIATILKNIYEDVLLKNKQ